MEKTDLINGIKVTRENASGNKPTSDSHDVNVYESINTAGIDLSMRKQAANTFNASIPDWESYNEENVSINRHTSQEELDRQRGENQSGLEQFGNFLVQAGINEVALGTAQGFVDIIDMISNIGNKNNDYTNPVTEQIENWKNNIRKEFAIYREDPNGTWGFDSGWFFDNAVSVASTVSLMIPSMTISKGLGTIGSYATKFMRNAAKTLNKVEDASNTLKAINKIENIAGYAVPAYISRVAENYQESRGVYQEVNEKSKDFLSKMTPEEKAEFIQDNPQYLNKTDDEIAADIASNAADETFKFDMKLYLLDLMQYKSLSKILKGATNKTANATLRLQNKRQILNMSKDTAEDAAKLANISTKAKIGEVFAPFKINPAKATWELFKTAEVSEGIEEAYQGIGTEKGKEYAELIFNPDYNIKSAADYITDPEIWEQAFWGMFGGVTFKGVGKGLNYLNKKVKAKDKNLTEEQRLAILNPENRVRELEIESRNGKFETLVNRINLINNGKNPFSPTTVNGQLSKDKDGNIIYDSIREEDKDTLKQIALDEFITDLTLTATEVGNYDLLKETINSENFNKYFREQGIDEVYAKQIDSYVKSKMDKVYDEYNEEIYKATTNVKESNPYTIKQLARHNYRQKQRIKAYNETLNKIDNEINNNEEVYFNYRKNVLGSFYNLMNDAIRRKKIQLNYQLNNKTISKQAYDEANEILDKQYNSLLKTILAEKGRIYDGNFRTAELQKEVDELNLPNDKIAKDDKVGQMLLSKLYTKYNILEAERQLPRTVQDYQNEYDRIAIDTDKMVIDRYNAAMAKVKDYISKQDNVDLALENIMTNNAKGLEKELDMLKFGSPTTKSYYAELLALADIEKSERAEKERKKEEAIIGEESIPTKKAKDINEELDAMNPSTGGKTESKTEETEDTSKDDETELKPINNVPESKLEKESRPKEVLDEELALSKQFKEDEKEITKAEEEAINNFQIDESILMNGDVFKLTTDYFNEHKDAFDSDNIDDLTLDIIDNIKEKLEDKYSKETIEDNIIKQTYKAVTKIKSILERKNKTDKANKLQQIIDNISTNYKFAKTDKIEQIEDNEIITYIEELLDIYSDVNNSVEFDGKKVINLEALLYKVYVSNELSNDEFITFYNNIKNNIDKISKYDIINNNLIEDANSYINHLKLKEIENAKQLSEAIHIQQTNNLNENYINTLISLFNEKENIPIKIVSTGNSLSYRVELNGKETEIGFATKVVKINNGYSKSTNSFGIDYRVVLNSDKTYSSNLDEFINYVLENKDNNRLLEVFYRLYKNNGDGYLRLNDKQFDFFLKDKGFNKLIKDNVINVSTGEDKISKYKVESVVNSLLNIILYDIRHGFENVSIEDFKNSYQHFIESVYKNYETTYNIQNKINTSNPPIARLSDIGGRNVLITEELNDINSIGIDSKKHTLVAVKNGKIIAENGTEEYDNIMGLQNGTMGVLVDGNQKLPIIAIFRDSEPINKNKELAKAIKAEIAKLLKDFQNKDISFEELYKKLNGLLSTKNDFSGGLFYGLSVGMFGGNKIAILKNNSNDLENKYETIVTIYKNKKDSNESGTGIVYKSSPDAEPKSRITVDEKFINNISEKLVSLLTYNKSFFSINNKNEDTNTDNSYLRKENGKIIIEIGNYKKEYDSFLDWIIDTNAFKTNQSYNAETNSYYTIDKVNGLYVEILDKDIETLTDDEKTSISHLTKKDEIKKEEDKKEEIKEEEKPKSILDNLKHNQEIIVSDLMNELFSDNLDVTIETLIDKSIIPDIITIDLNTPLGYAYYNNENKKIYLSKDAIENIKKNPSELSRLLFHEKAHANLSDFSTFERKEIVDEINNLVDEFLNKIKDNKEYSNVVKFINDLRNLYKDKRLFAEEFIAESVSQPVLFKALNEINYSDNPIENTESFWTKLFNIIARIFKVDINNQSYLAKEIELLQGRTPVEESTDVESNKTFTDIIDNETKEDEKEVTKLENKEDKNNTIDSVLDEKDINVINTENKEIIRDKQLQYFFSDVDFYYYITKELKLNINDLTIEDITQKYNEYISRKYNEKGQNINVVDTKDEDLKGFLTITALELGITHTADIINDLYLTQFNTPADARMSKRELLYNVRKQIDDKVMSIAEAIIYRLENSNETKNTKTKRYIAAIKRHNKDIEKLKEKIYEIEELINKSANNPELYNANIEKLNILRNKLAKSEGYRYVAINELIKQKGSKQEINYAALYNNIRLNPYEWFSKAFESPKLVNIYSKFKTILEDSNDFNEQFLDEAEYAKGENEVDQSTKNWDSAAAKQFDTDIDSELKAYFNSLNELDAPVNTNNPEYVLNLDNELGVSTKMNDRFIISQLCDTGYGSFYSVNDFIYSIEKASQTIPELYGLGALVVRMKEDRVFANKVFTQLRKPAIVKAALIMTENGIEFNQTNRASDPVSVLIFDMMNAVRITVNNHNEHFTNILNDLIRRARGNKLDGYLKDKILNAVTDVIRVYFPYFDNTSITLYLTDKNSNVSENDRYKNLLNLVFTLSSQINSIVEKNQQKEIANNSSLNDAIISLAQTLRPYLAVKTELNSTNSENNLSSDLINNSYITYLNTLINYSTAENPNAGLEMIKEDISKNIELYRYNTFLFGVRDYKGKVIQKGLFTLNPDDSIEINKNAKDIFKLMLFDGVKDTLNNDGVSYAKMSKADYTLTSLMVYNKSIKSPGKNTQNLGNFFLKTPSDKPKNYLLQVPRYNTSGLFTSNESELKYYDSIIEEFESTNVVLSVSNSKQNYTNKIKDLSTIIDLLLNGDISNIDFKNKRIIKINGKDVFVLFHDIKENDVNYRITVQIELNGNTPNIIGIGLYDLTNKKPIKANNGKELLQLMPQQFKDNIIERGKQNNEIERSINENNIAFLGLYNALLEELNTFVNQLNYITKKDSNDKTGSKLGRKIVEDTINLFELYHYKNKIIDDNGKLTGNVFKFTKLYPVPNKDGNGNYNINDILETMLSLYGGANALITKKRNNYYVNLGRTDLIKIENGNIKLNVTEDLQNKLKKIVKDWIDNYSVESLKRISKFDNIINNQFDTNDKLDFAINSYLQFLNFDNLIDGDTKFYKDAQTVLKRAAEVQAGGSVSGGVDLSIKDNGLVDLLNSNNTTIPILINGEQLTVPTYINGKIVDSPMVARNGFRAVTIENIINVSKSGERIKQDIINSLRNTMSPEKAEEIAETISNRYKSDKTKFNDAQSYITFEEWIRRVYNNGDLSKYEDIIQQILDVRNGIKKLNEIDVKNILARIQVQKHFYFDLQVDPITGVRYSRQIKNAEFVLIPEFIKGTQLEKLYNIMTKYDIGQINTKETSKAANRNILNFWESDGSINKSFVQNIKKQNYAAVETYYYKYLYKQQDVPQHMMDEHNKFGLQLYKKLGDNATDSIKEKVEKFFTLYSTNIKDSFDTLIKNMGWKIENGKLYNEDGTEELNFTYFYDKARIEAQRLGMDSNFIEYLTPDILGNPIMPNFMNVVSSKFESIAQSIFNNSVTRQEFPGWHAAQVTGIGFIKSSEYQNAAGYANPLHYHPIIYTKIDENENKIELYEEDYNKLSDKEKQGFVREQKPYIEVILPYWTKKLYLDKLKAVNPNKTYTDEEIIKMLNDEELVYHIGYRTPTEAKYSASVLRVIGFTPETMGSTIIVPDEWVTQTGSDFDVDSIYGMCYEMYIDKDGIPRKVKYIDSTTELDNYNLYKNYILKNTEDVIKLNSVTREDIKKLIDSNWNRTKEIINSLYEFSNIEEYNNQLNDLYQYLPKEIKEIVNSRLGFKNVKYKDRISDLAKDLNNIDANTIEKEKAKQNFIEYRDVINNLNEEFNNLKEEEQEIILNHNKDTKQDIEDLKNKTLRDNINKLNEAASVNKLLSYSDFIKLPVEERNSREARNNKILDLMIEILSDDNSKEENYSGNNFDDIIKYMEEMKNAKGEKSIVRSPYNVFDQIDFQENAISGRTLKGISVNRDTLNSINNYNKTILNRGHEISVDYDLDVYDRNNIEDAYDINDIEYIDDKGNIYKINNNENNNENNIIETNNEILNTLGGVNYEPAKEELKDTVKTLKKGITFSEALNTVTPIFNEEEIEQIKKALGNDKIRITSLFRNTDPVAHAKEVIEFLKENAKKPFTDKTRVNAVEIWTKHDGQPLKDILDACKKYKVAPMVSFSITSLGDTPLEKGVLKYQDLLNLIKQLVENGDIDPRTTAIRIDPILVGYTNMDDIKDIVYKCKELGFKKFVTSLVQSYGNLEGTTNDRKVVSGINNALATVNQTYDWDKYYGRNKWGKVNFIPKEEYIKEVGDILIELNKDKEIEIETCSFFIKGLKPAACLDPYIIEKLVGVNPFNANGTYNSDRTRPDCKCYGAHGDAPLTNKKCFSSCAYCYAGHSVDNKLKYYDDNGNLIENKFTTLNNKNIDNILKNEEINENINYINKEELNNKNIKTIRVKHNRMGWSNNNRNVEGKLITAYSAQTTAHILDVIKTGAVPNENAYTFGTFKTLVDLGIDYRTAIGFLMQPGVDSIVNAYFENESIFVKSSANPINTAFKRTAAKLNINIKGYPISSYTSLNSIKEALREDYKFNQVYYKLFGITFDENNIPTLNSNTLKDRLENKLKEIRFEKEIVDKDYVNAVFDLGVILQFNKYYNTSRNIETIGNALRTDAFGAKVSVKETKDVLQTIKENISDEKGFVSPVGNTLLGINSEGRRAPLLDCIYPNFSIENPMNVSVENSTYKPLAAFLKYSTSSSVFINTQLLSLEHPDFDELISAVESDVLLNKKLNKEEVKAFKQSIINYLYKSNETLNMPLILDENGNISQDLDTINICKNANINEVDYETYRIKGFVIKNCPIKGNPNMTIKNINKPTNDELKEFAKLTPAQKVIWIQQNIKNEKTIFPFLKVSYNRNDNGMSIKFNDQVNSINTLINYFKKAFNSNNKIIRMAAIDLVKYAFIAEQFKFKKGYISKIVPNSALYNNIENKGLNILDDLKANVSNILYLKENNGLSEITDDFVKDNINLIKTIKLSNKKSDSKTESMNVTFNRCKYKINDSNTGLIVIRENDNKNNSRLLSDIYSNSTGRYINIQTTVRKEEENKNETINTLYKIVNNKDVTYLIPIYSSTGEVVKEEVYNYIIKEIDNNNDGTNERLSQLLKESKNNISNAEGKIDTNIINNLSRGNIIEQSIANHIIDEIKDILENNSGFSSEIAFPTNITYPKFKINNIQKVTINDENYIIKFLNDNKITKSRLKALGGNSKNGYYIKIIKDTPVKNTNIKYAITESLTDKEINTKTNNKTFQLTDTDKLAESIYREINRKAIIEKGDDTAALSFREQMNKLNIGYKDANSIYNNKSNILLAAKDYYIRKSNELLEQLENFEIIINQKVDNNIETSIQTYKLTDENLYKNLSKDPTSYDRLVKLILEAKTFGEQFDEIFSIIKGEDDLTTNAIESIKRSITKVKLSPYTTKGLKYIFDIYMADNYSTNPNVRQGIVDLTTEFGDINFFDLNLADIGEVKNKQIQTTLKLVYGIMNDVELNEVPNNIKAFTTAYNNIMKSSNEPVDFNKIIDKNGKRRKQYTDKFIEDKLKYDEKVNKAKENFDKDPLAYEKAKLEREAWRIKNLEREIDVEYYKKLYKLKENIIRVAPKEYAQYVKLKEELRSLPDIPETTSKDINDKRNTILVKIKNLLNPALEGSGLSIEALERIGELNKFVKKIKELNSYYFDFEENPTYISTKEKFEKLIENYDNAHPNDNIEQKLQNSDYKEAYNWLQTNTIMILDKNVYDTLSKAYDTLRKTKGENIYSDSKSINRLEDKDVYDNYGTIDGRKVSDEDRKAIKENQENRYNILKEDSELDASLIKSVYDDKPILNKLFSPNSNYDGKYYRELLTKINEYIIKGLDYKTGKLDTIKLLNELSEKEVRELINLYNNLKDYKRESFALSDGKIDKDIIRKIDSSYSFELTRSKTELSKDKQKLWLELFTESASARRGKRSSTTRTARFDIFGYYTSNNKDLIDTKRTEARNLIKDTIEYVPTEYYYIALNEAIKNGTYEKWFKDNHVYNPYQHKYEPLKYWTKRSIKPNNKLGAKYERAANYFNRYNTVKEDKRNPEYNKEYNNYNSKTGEYNNKTILNNKEKELLKLFNDTLDKYTTSYEGRKFIGEGYMPRRAVNKINAKYYISQVFAALGYESRHSSETPFDDEVNYINDKEPDFPMLNFIHGKSKLVKPVRLANESEENFNKRLAEYEDKYKQEQIDIDNELRDNDWYNVMQDFIEKATLYNARRKVRNSLFLLQESIKQSQAYKVSRTTNRLKVDKKKSNSINTEYEKEDLNNAYQMVTNLIQRLVYRQFKKDSKLNKYMDTLQNITSAKYMILNIPGGIANIGTGFANIINESFAKQFFDNETLYKATWQYRSNAFAFIGSMYSDTTDNFNVALTKYFNIVDLDYINERRPTETASEYVKRVKDALYGFQSMGEHYMQNSVLFAMLNSHRVKEVNGKLSIVSYGDYVNNIEYMAVKSLIKDNEILSDAYDNYIAGIKEDLNNIKNYDRFRNNPNIDFIRSLNDKDLLNKFLDLRKDLLKNSEKEFNTLPKLIDQFRVVNGKIDTKEGVKFNDEEIGQFKTKVIEVNKKIHGSYDKLGAARIEREWWGGLVMQYHKHIYPGIMKRYRINGYYNELRGNVEMGSYVSLVRYLTTEYRNFKKDYNMKLQEDNANSITAAIGVVFQETINTFTNLALNWKLLPKWEQNNIRRILGDLYGIMSAVLLATAIYALTDDDELKESDLLSTCLYLADRLYAETAMYNPYGLNTEFKTLWSSPIASYNSITDLMKATSVVSQTLFDDEFNPYYTTGLYKGQHKALVMLYRNIPAYRIYRRISTMSKNNSYYKLGDTGVNMKVAKNIANIISEE